MIKMHLIIEEQINENIAMWRASGRFFRLYSPTNKERILLLKSSVISVHRE